MARKKRYNLLFSKSKKLNIKNILLGHHQDDLLENFFIRMLRGSGLKGLISLDKKKKIEGVNLLRPLIDQKKEDLVFLSKIVFNFYIKDPTNKDPKYQRIKIRKLIKELQDNGLDKKKFLKTINNLKSSNKIVDFYVSENLKKNSFLSNKKDRLILNKEFFLQPYEVVFRALSDSIRIIGKRYYSVRGKKVDRIIKDILDNRLYRVTLGGCLIEKISESIILSKEH